MKFILWQFSLERSKAYEDATGVNEIIVQMKGLFPLSIQINKCFFESNLVNQAKVSTWN